MSVPAETQKLESIRSQKIFFIICWITYFCTYIGRLNFTASLAEISMSSDFSKAELGMVSSGFFIGYGIFQLIWGFAGDRLNPVHMVFSGILGSGLLNLAMACAQSVGIMAVLWTLNGIVQAAVWSPLLKLTLDRLPDEIAMRASIRYATTVPLGTFAAYLLAAVCALFGSWRTDFAISGAFLTVVAIIWNRSMHVLAPNPIAKLAHGKNIMHTGNGTSVTIWLILIPICLATLVNGFIRDSVQTWMPSYLSELHGLDSFSSIALTLILPLVNLSGVYIGAFFNDHLFHNEVLTSATAFSCAALFLLPVVLGLHIPLWLALILFGLCAAMMLAVNTMFVTLVPVRLQFTGRTSTLSGILNSATYVGSALSGYGVGWVLENRGWDTVLTSWLLGLLLAAILCVILFHKWARLR